MLAVGVFGATRWLLGSAPAVRVVYARAQSGGQPLVGAALSGTGYAITAEKYIAIGVRVPGRIERFFVDEGDHVEVGQVLVELDDRDYRAQAGRAEAALRVAQANRKLAAADRQRTRKLFAEGVASRQELDQLESRFEVMAANVAQAENDLAQARVNLGDTKLRSPVRGVVLAKLKGVGEIAVPGGFSGSGDLLRLADLSEIRAEVDISEADLASVHLGQDAEVVPDAFSQRRYRGSVVKLYPQVNRQKGTLKVEVKIAEPDSYLLPDMSVRVTFLAAAVAADRGGEKPVVTVARSGVRRGPEGAYVWLVAEHRLRRQPIEVGSEVGEDTVVNRGLNGGEAVVVGADAGFREGRAVSVEGPRS